MGWAKFLRRPTSIVDDEVVAFDGTAGLVKSSGVDKDDIGAGNGDVVGPASGTDEAIARFDSTTGKLLQNSTVTISDSGLISGSNLAVGAASSTDNAVSRFDSTTGKILQNSGVIIDDSNNLSGINNINCASLIPTGDCNIGSTDNLFLSGWLLLNDAATVAISSGSITSLTGSLHVLADATDNLDGISNSSSVENRFLILLAPATGTITVRDAQSPASAKPFALGASTRVLTGNSSITLVYTGTVWQEISYSPNT